jgi:hypothetical protein
MGSGPLPNTGIQEKEKKRKDEREKKEPLQSKTTTQVSCGTTTVYTLLHTD